MANKPEYTKTIVASVPHSGTRTLQQFLSERYPDRVPPDRDMLGHWHFNFHPKYIELFAELAEIEGDRQMHIPVRNPADLCDSWQRRYGDAPDKTATDMISALGLMFGWMTHPCARVWKIEELPRLRGHGPNPEGWDRQNSSDRLNEVRGWILREPSVANVYRELYTPEELWWL